MTNGPRRFVALEGIDNGGKTSLLTEISNAVSARMPIHVTREFTSPIGSYVKTALAAGHLSSLDKVLLFAADRQLRLSNGLASYLAGPGLCVADRWTLSAEAYRSADDPSLAPYVEAVNSVFPKPSLTILIDLPADLSLQRGAPINKNSYTAAYLDIVRNKYLALASSRDVLIVDGTLPFNVLSQAVIAAVVAHVGTPS